MHAPSIWGILVVAVVVILLFGRGKISGMMGEVASGIKAFQKGMKDDDRPAERIQTTADIEAAREAEKTSTTRDV
ncbi:twin-arginine translocase TatA/TatE family subunit [Devosia rhizoryzae]|uniref:Sec-independent protein translocase protein TatA n=1 Tax=Devosia rhizoryzae TaxID=2774137 RepID=A0ABX7C967_9HYPH|nr:twin-arginine translocase TatA/TatE family subunit [Devosia rhizoryzae]QQR40820.1 twin-arginine translocase TatA/TatE family subunit [Devosia rhizoryzae]